MSNLIPASHLVNASMSKTDLLLQCTYWASPYVTLPTKSGIEPVHLRFGSGFHKCDEIYLKSFGKKHPNIPAVAKKYDIDAKRLKNFYTRWREFIDAILAAYPKNTERRVEEKLVYDPFLDTARILQSTKERDYSERKPTEIPGTGDLVLIPPDEDWFAVFDWKTGSTDYDKELNGQLASLALGTSRMIKRYNVRAYIVRIDDTFIEPYEWKWNLSFLETHRKNLRTKMSEARSPNPSMRPGMHCSKLYCPMIETCPTQQDPMSLGDATHSLDDPEKKAFYFAKFKAAEKMMEAMKERWKREVEMNGPFQLEDGRWACLVPDERDNLSKASIRRALGDVDGNDVIRQLDEAGCIDHIARTKLDYRKNPPGTP
jgi:hypothetical protein